MGNDRDRSAFVSIVMTKRTLRIVWDIGLLAALLYLPVWCTAIVMLGGIALFSSYYESILAAIILDALYGRYGALSGFFHSHEVFIMTSAVFLVSFWLKDRMRTQSY